MISCLSARKHVALRLARRSSLCQHMPVDDELEPCAPEFIVSNVLASISFYQQALGFELLRKDDDDSFAIMRLPETGACLLLAQRDAAATASVVVDPQVLARMVNIRYLVARVDEYYEKCKQHPSATILTEVADRYYGLRDFIVTDPDGFSLRMASVCAAAPTAASTQP